MQKLDIKSRTDDLSEESVLARVLPEQVSRNWSHYAEVVGLSLPPNVTKSTQAMINVLKSVLKDELICWNFISDGEIKAVITTNIYRDTVSGSRDLMIYSFTTLTGDVSSYDWSVIIESLRDYAVSVKCKGIVAFTTNPRVAEFLESQGANIDNILIQMEV